MTNSSGLPEGWYINQSEQLIAAERKNSELHRKIAERNRAIAASKRESADHHDQIAALHDQLAESTSEAIDAGVDLSLMARQHDQANEVWALRQDRQLNIERDQRTDAMDAKLQSLERDVRELKSMLIDVVEKLGDIANSLSFRSTQGAT